MVKNEPRGRNASAPLERILVSTKENVLGSLGKCSSFSPYCPEGGVWKVYHIILCALSSHINDLNALSGVL